MIETSGSPPPVYSPRPGFTYIGGTPTTVGPVVVPIDDSHDSYLALRAAADHAMSRSSGLVVLADTSTKPGVFTNLDTRETAASIGILNNTHVSTIPLDDLDTTAVIEECLALDASLLVMSAAKFEDVVTEPSVLSDLLQAAVDVLLVTRVTR